MIVATVCTLKVCLRFGTVFPIVFPPTKQTSSFRCAAWGCMTYSLAVIALQRPTNVGDNPIITVTDPDCRVWQVLYRRLGSNQIIIPGFGAKIIPTNLMMQKTIPKIGILYQSYRSLQKFIPIHKPFK